MKNLDLEEMLTSQQIEMETSSIAKKDAAHQWHPYTQMKDFGVHLPVESAKGCKLTLEDGSEIIDAISSWWVNLYGHGHPHIQEKIGAQVGHLDHVLFAGFTHRPAVELADRLLKLVPQNLNRLFFSDNGSTSIEVAMKMVLQYFLNKGEKRRTLLAFEDAYHGDTFGAMAAGGLGVFNHAFADMLLDVKRIPVPSKGKEAECLKALEAIDLNDVCGFLFEPLVQGAAGMRFYDGETLDLIIERIQLAGGFCIADEVMTGFGRLEHFLASDTLMNKPDIVCLSKGLTAGVLPMGLTLATEELYNGFYSDDRSKAFMHGHSFTANPLGCAAALAGLDLWESDMVQFQRQNLINHQKTAAKNFAKHPKAKNVRNLGTLLALELDLQYAEETYGSKRDELYAFFIEKGILLRPLGNTLYVLPPYTIEDSELKSIYTAIEACLDAL